MKMRKLTRAIRYTVFLTTFYFAAVICAGLLARPDTADVAVVLGNEVLNTGKPSARLAARLDCAYALYRTQKITAIIVSGGIGASGFDEATAMAQYLIERGIPKDHILLDSNGINTMATAKNTARILEEHHWKSVVAVSQYFHLPRTEIAFHITGMRNISADYPLFFEWRDLFSILREMVAIPAYIMAAIRNN